MASQMRLGAQITSGPFVRQLSPATRYVLRGGPQVMASAGNALGLEISAVACRAAAAENPPLAALWLGPDEQLLLGPDGSDFGTVLIPALRNLPHSLVDVSHRQTALEASGPHATAL
jgi:sarcosine oxidase subunit gamma